MPVTYQEPILGLLVSVGVAVVVHEPVPTQTAALKLLVEGCANPLPVAQVGPPPLAGPAAVAKFNAEVVETAIILGLPELGDGFDTEEEVDDENALELDKPLLPPAIYA